MFSGAQLSLYPMTDVFVPVILDAIKALDPYRDRVRIETDDLSTLVVGPPELLFDAMRDLFVAGAAGGVHCVLSACVSRGCPGSSDDPICGSLAREGRAGPVEERISSSVEAVRAAGSTGTHAAAQFSLYPLGDAPHMDEIWACIDFLKRSGTFDREKNFCTRLGGDAAPVFATLREAFVNFGDPDGHVTIDLTVSAHSPSRG